MYLINTNIEKREIFNDLVIKKVVKNVTIIKEKVDYIVNLVI